MSSTFYFSAWTDSGCLLGCPHEHQTVTSATACISHAGGYVIAAEKGEFRALTDDEEKEFQKALCGGKADSKQQVNSVGILSVLFTI